MILQGLAHLPEWMFDQKMYLNIFPLIQTLIVTLTLNLTLTLKHKNVFRKTKWHHFLGKNPDNDFACTLWTLFYGDNFYVICLCFIHVPINLYFSLLCLLAGMTQFMIGHSSWQYWC